LSSNDLVATRPIALRISFAAAAENVLASKLSIFLAPALGKLMAAQL